MLYFMKMDPKYFKVTTGHFGSTTKEEKAKLMEERNAKNTNKATKSAVRALISYLIEKELLALCGVSSDNLPELLLNFYTHMRAIKNELYNIQTLKCMRSNLNRYLKESRNIDICTDKRFIKTNEMFKAIKVRSKLAGKGVRGLTVPIDDIDVKKINDYFKDVDYMNKPNPRKLGRNVLFKIIYYTCCRGVENLEYMSLDQFKVITENYGTRYVI